MGLKGNRTGSFYGCGYWVGFGSGGYIYIYGVKPHVLSFPSFLSLSSSLLEREALTSLFLFLSPDEYSDGVLMNPVSDAVVAGQKRQRRRAGGSKLLHFCFFFALSSLFPLFYPIPPYKFQERTKKENITLSFWICFVVVRLWCLVRWYVHVLWFMCYCAACVSLWATAKC